MGKQKTFCLFLIVVLANANVMAECEQHSVQELADLAFKDIQDLLVVEPEKNINPSELITTMMVENKKQNITEKFNKNEIEKIKLKSMDILNIEKVLYQNRVSEGFKLPQETAARLNKIPYSIIWVDATKTDECSGKVLQVKEKRLIIPKKVIEYQNLSGDKRYLLPIELWKITESNKNVFFENPYIELFLFQQKGENEFQLVSRTPPHYDGFENENFDLIYDELVKNITPLGLNRMGSYFEKVYSLFSYPIPSIASWDILMLSEDDFIQNFALDLSRENTFTENVAENLRYKFSSSLKILAQKDQEYFPIEIKYSGTRMNRYGVVKPNNKIVSLYFDQNKKVYLYNSLTYQILLDEQ
ncbi:hypothetical protein [Acinetobacter gyllenbergii]|uniref:hypothetical protein n=1 Tax=Acinetobacter gyllenbergii TaxID=134534 RepID=UPI003F56D199